MGMKEEAAVKPGRGLNWTVPVQVSPDDQVTAR